MSNDEQIPRPRGLGAIGARCVALRKAMARTQAEFCRQVEVPRNTWSQYEKAHRRPALEFALLLKDRTGATLDWIYTGDTAGLPQGLAVALLQMLTDNAIPPPNAISRSGRATQPRSGSRRPH